MAKPSLNYYQALHVGKDKTDVIQFTTIQAAIDAITDNASGKRYAVYVHPGTYNEKITMEDYVDLIAIGGREETIITYTATADNEPTLTAENSMVKGFTIVSDGTNFVGRSVEAGTAGFEMDDCVLEIANPQGTEVALNATASFDMRTCVVDDGGNALTGINLETDAQTYNIKDSELGAGTNSLILAANTYTLNLLNSRVSNLIDKNGGTANIRNSILEEIDEDGGTLNLHQSYVETIAADGGTVTAYGGTIRACSSSTGTSFVWWEEDNTIKVIANMLIADALAAAAAGDTILVHPGTYAESNLTLVASVNLVGTDPDQCQIVTGDAVNPIINSGVSCTLSNLTIGNTNAGAAAIAVTAGTLILRNCYVYGTGAGDAIAMTGGALIAYDTEIDAGDIDLSTGACTLSMYRCRITTDPIDTAGALAHTLVFEQCDFGNQNIASAATGATTLDMTGCSHVGQVSNAGTGAFTIRDSDVGDVTTTSTGDITVYGGDVGTCAAASAGGAIVWWEDTNTIKVIAGMLIAHALAAAAAGDTILIYPGTYAESNLTLVASVNLVGTDPDQCQIVTGDAGNPILNSGVSCTLSNLTIGNTNAGAAGIAVTAGTLILRNCYVYGTGAGDAIAMTGGALTAYDTQIGAGDIDLSTGACTLSMYRCRITTDPVDTSGALAHTLVFEQCDFGNQNIASAATGATTLDMTGCSHVGQVSNAGSGAFTIRDSDLGDVTTTSTGSITIYGGDVGTCAAASAGGAIVWWKHTNLIYVLSAMLIAHALAAASAGDTIALAQGTFAESNLTAVNGVDIIGEGQDLSIIEATDNTNPIITVGSGVTCVIQGVKISNLGTAEAVAVSAGAGAASLTVRDCLLKSDAAGSIVTVTTTAAGAPTFIAYNTTFDTGADAITVTGAVAATVIARGCVFDTCTLAFSTTGANHIFRIDGCDFSADNATFAGITLSANAPVVTLSECSGIGLVTHSTASTVNIYNCRFFNTYTIGAVAGVVNAYNTQFATFTNNGSGAISFEECFGTDVNNNLTSTMDIKGGNWNTVRNGGGGAGSTLNIREAVVDTELEGNGPGWINAYNCQIIDIDSNGGYITLYGGDLQAISDATGVIRWWEAPHRLRVIASTANMSIQEAASVSSAGDIIVIGPGTFSENLTLDTAGQNCTFRGMGRDATIITATHETVYVDGITGVVLEDLTIEASACTNGHGAVEVNAFDNDTTDLILRNVTVRTTGVADGVTVYGLQVWDDGVKVATVIAFDCSFEAASGNTNYAVAADTCTTPTSTISLYNCILNGTDYDIYNDYLVCDMHECELQGGGAYIANNAGAVCLVFNNEPMADPTPVVFAGAAGVFADLSGCELWSCSGATEALYEWVYVSANDTVDEADADGANTYPSVGVIVYKPSDTTCYVKKHGYLYKPGAGWTAGAIEYLSTTAGAETETRPSNAVVQKLGVAKNATTMLVNVDIVENPTKWLTIPIAWGAGSAPTGTHVNGNSRRAVAIAVAGQTVFSQMVAVPEDFLTFSKLYVVLFPTGTGTFDWTAYSSAASNGEAENTHSDTDTADGQAATDNEILDHDISGAADGYTMVEQDKFSAEFIVDVLTTLTQVCVLGFKLEYVAQYGS